MHTFFINTSKKILDDYKVLFDVYYENRTLVSMNCELDNWYDEELGSAHCIKRMREMIDNYIELNNDFNLIVYIDLTEIEEYSKISRDAFHDEERAICFKAMRILFTHIVSETLVKELVSSGFEPKNVLLMFGEDKNFSDFEPENTDIFNEKTMQSALSLLGLPSEEKIKALVDEAMKCEAGDRLGKLLSEIEESCEVGFFSSIRKSYVDDIKLWCEELLNLKSVAAASLDLFDRMNDVDVEDTERIGIKSISCKSDYKAEAANRRACAIGRMNLALYILRCVLQGSIYEGGESKEIMPFTVYTAEAIAPILAEKIRIYKTKQAETRELSDSYTRLKLAPELYEFDCVKFGMDEYGAPLTDVEMIDGEDDGEDEASLLSRGKKKELILVKTKKAPLITEELSDFRFKDPELDETLKANSSPEKYVEEAKKIKKHHVLYLKKLKEYVSDTLSNYSGRSDENERPVLKKRHVSIGLDDALEEREYEYAKEEDTRSGKRGLVKETRKIKNVKDTADAAYDTSVLEYLSFFVNRSVAVSNIDEQCDWFVTKIERIKASLNKIKLVAMGMLIALLVLYIPFVVIQWDAIIENLFTLGIALTSIAVPFAILCATVIWASLSQKKKYFESWQEFKQKSEAALAENDCAAREFYLLLSSVTPSLRWVYEYKLDVEFYAECCRLARAKLDYHGNKLKEMIGSLNNILEDLDVDSTTVKETTAILEARFQTALDYNASFSTGEKNCKFYSVVDSEFFRVLTEGGKE